MKFNIPPEIVAAFDEVTALSNARRDFETARAANAEALKLVMGELQAATDADEAAEVTLALAFDADEVARAVASVSGNVEADPAADGDLKELTARRDAAAAVKKELSLRVERMERIERGLAAKIEEIGPRLDGIGAAAASAWADFEKQQEASVVAMLVAVSAEVAEIQEYGFAIAQAFGASVLRDQMEAVFLPHPYWLPHRTLIGRGRHMTAQDISKDLSTSWADTPVAKVHREIVRLRRVLQPVIENGVKVAAEVVAQQRRDEAEALRLAEKQRQAEARTAADAAWKPPAGAGKPASWTVRSPGAPTLGG